MLMYLPIDAGVKFKTILFDTLAPSYVLIKGKYGNIPYRRNTVLAGSSAVLLDAG